MRGVGDVGEFLTKTLPTLFAAQLGQFDHAEGRGNQQTIRLHRDEQTRDLILGKADKHTDLPRRGALAQALAAQPIEDLQNLIAQTQFVKRHDLTPSSV